MACSDTRSSSSHLQGDLPSADTLITNTIKTLSFDLMIRKSNWMQVNNIDKIEILVSCVARLMAKSTLPLLLLPRFSSNSFPHPLLSPSLSSGLTKCTSTSSKVLPSASPITTSPSTMATLGNVFSPLEGTLTLLFSVLRTAEELLVLSRTLLPHSAQQLDLPALANRSLWITSPTSTETNR